MTNDVTTSKQSPAAEEKAAPASSGEPAMSKPSAVWMLVPILLIALAIFLAR
jgi:hypothetical protein